MISQLKNHLSKISPIFFELIQMSKRYIPIKNRWQHHREASILSMVGGWLNTVSFIALFGIYTNHITGYIVTAGIETIVGGLGLWIIFISAFIVTISLTAWCEHKWKETYPNILLAFFVAETAFLSLFMLSGLFFGPFESVADLGAIITAVFGIIAMGIRNAMIRTLLSNITTSTLMTGNIAQLTIDLTLIYSSPDVSQEKKNTAKQNISKILPSVLSFATGAILGAICYMLIGFLCMIVPILSMIYICYREWRFSFLHAH